MPRRPRRFLSVTQWLIDLAILLFSYGATFYDRLPVLTRKGQGFRPALILKSDSNSFNSFLLVFRFLLSFYSVHSDRIETTISFYRSQLLRCPRPSRSPRKRIKSCLLCKCSLIVSLMELYNFSRRWPRNQNRPQQMENETKRGEHFRISGIYILIHIIFLVRFYSGNPVVMAGWPTSPSIKGGI